MSALSAVGRPVKARFRFRNEIGEWVDYYQKYKTEKLEPKLMNEEIKLTDEARQNIAAKVQVVDEFMVEINTALQEKPKETDLPWTIEQVENKIEALKAEVHAILTAPPPKPKEEKKEEAKEESKDGQAEADKEEASGEPGADQQDNGDVDMKDEGQPAADGEKPDAQMDAAADAGQAN